MTKNPVQTMILKRMLLLAFPLILLIPMALLAQNGPELRLSQSDSASYTSPNYARSVAASGNAIHVVYYGKRDGSQGIFYRRSLDGGKDWGYEAALEKGSDQVRYPSVAASGKEIHVVWEEKRGKVINVFYKRSGDGGLSWVSETQLTDDTTDSVCPMIAVTAHAVSVVWQNYTRDPFMPGISSRRSTDRGKTWGPVVPLCRDQVFSDHPSLSASGSDIYLVWEWGAKRSGVFRVGYRHSGDDGKNWDPMIFLTPDSMISYSPTIAVAGTDVHLVWEERKLKQYFMRYQRSTDAGKTWGRDTILAPVSTVEPEPTVAASGARILVAWNDSRDGQWGVFARYSTDGGKTWGPEVRLTPKTSDASDPSAAFSGSTANIVWSDKRNGSWQVYHERIVPGKP